MAWFFRLASRYFYSQASLILKNHRMSAERRAPAARLLPAGVPMNCGIAAGSFEHGGWNAGFAGVFLHVLEFLLGGFERLLLGVYIVLLLLAFFSILGLVAQLDAGVGVVSSGFQPGLALIHIEFAL